SRLMVAAEAMLEESPPREGWRPGPPGWVFAEAHNPPQRLRDRRCCGARPWSCEKIRPVRAPGLQQSSRNPLRLIGGGPNHPSVDTILSSLAKIYRRHGKPAKAIDCLHRALKIREKSLGPEHPETAVTINQLAACLLW